MQRLDLHNHTKYSNMRLKDALSTPEQLINRAIELNLKGIAITEHEFLGSHPIANQYAQKIKNEHPEFKVILGNEIYLVDERPQNDHYHFILLAKDAIGHKQLRRLSTIAWLNGYQKFLFRTDTLKSDLEMIIRENPGHLIASTACIGGELGKRILRLTEAEKLSNAVGAKEEHDGIVKFLLWLKNLFKNDVYLECQPGISQEQIIVNRRLISIANAFDIKMIPTSDSHYLKKEDRFVHKSFLDSEDKEREVDSFYQDCYLHSNEEMIEKFKKSGYDELFVEKMFANTLEIYDKVQDFSLLHAQQIPKVEVPNYEKIEPPPFLDNYPLLSKMYQSEDKIERYWINTCINKLEEINKVNKEYLDELEEEAEVKTIIGKKLNTNMFSYPITLAHYIDLFWNCGSTVGVGRGSACSALNHYLLGITQLDPIQWNFPFYRYMNRDTEGLGSLSLILPRR